jgi:2-deoxy-D-gluconate 3-dehydrogenase
MTNSSSTIDLNGKTALVTGASRGIGLAIARVLSLCGADVIGIGTAITQDADSLRKHFKENSGRFIPMDCDLSDRDALADLLAKIDAEGRRIDILVNNAGIIRRKAAVTHSTEDWDAVMAVNLDAVFILSQALGSRMLERGQGKIINIASVLSFQGGIFVPGYAAAKGAIAQLTRALANEWAASGVNVNAVAPGYIATDNTAALQHVSQLLCRFIKKFLQDSSRMKRNPTWHFTFRFQFLTRVSTSERMGQKMGSSNGGAACS